MTIEFHFKSLITGRDVKVSKTLNTKPEAIDAAAYLLGEALHAGWELKHAYVDGEERMRAGVNGDIIIEI